MCMLAVELSDELPENPSNPMHLGLGKIDRNQNGLGIAH